MYESIILVMILNTYTVSFAILMFNIRSFIQQIFNYFDVRPLNGI